MKSDGLNETGEIRCSWEICGWSHWYGGGLGLTHVYPFHNCDYTLSLLSVSWMANGGCRRYVKQLTSLGWRCHCNGILIDLALTLKHTADLKVDLCSTSSMSHAPLTTHEPACHLDSVTTTTSRPSLTTVTTFTTFTIDHIRVRFISTYLFLVINYLFCLALMIIFTHWGWEWPWWSSGQLKYVKPLVCEMTVTVWQHIYKCML